MVFLRGPAAAERRRVNPFLEDAMKRQSWTGWMRRLRRTPPASRGASRLRLEVLEDRLAPATDICQASTNPLLGNRWSVDANWDCASPACDANALLIFSSNPTRFDSVNDGIFSIQKIDIIGSGYSITPVPFGSGRISM